MFAYKTGDGNDSIVGFNTTSTLQIDGGKGAYSTVKSESGADIIVTVGTGKITLVGAANLSKVNIDGIQKEAALMVTNKTPNSVVAGTTYDDDIDNRANNATLLGGDGNDVLTTLRQTSNVKLYGEAGDDTLEAYNATKVLLNGGADDDEIYISGGANNTAVGGTGNDTIEIDSVNVQIQYTAGDGNDLIQGFDETTILKIGNGTGTYSTTQSSNAGDVVLSVGDSKITLSGVGDFDAIKDQIQGEFKDPIVTFDDSTPWQQTLGEEVELADATERTKSFQIHGNNLPNTTILGGNGRNTIWGGEGDNLIVGGTNADSILGEAGHDTLNGGAGNDTLIGGEGEDVFIYTAGKDVISGYKEGEDIIKLGEDLKLDDIVQATTSGANVYVSLGGGNYISVIGGKGQNITIVDSTGAETILGDTTEIYTNDSSWQQELKPTSEVADASTRTKSTQIHGNAIDNTILGGSARNTIWGGEGDDYIRGGSNADSLLGEAGHDTLDGGEGNDTLIGGDGENVFVYTAGKDVISDYTVGKDIISLGSATFDEVKGTSYQGNARISLAGGNYISILGGQYSNVTLHPARKVIPSKNPAGFLLTRKNFRVIIAWRLLDEAIRCGNRNI